MLNFTSQGHKNILHISSIRNSSRALRITEYIAPISVLVKYSLSCYWYSEPTIQNCFSLRGQYHENPSVFLTYVCTIFS